ncbi:uncharacterized protein LOC128246640 [Mya arenaria]|uniref:uncharacterized protein LOC128246640 n=1 Tax=Mya arenaria TaxID=6604 RepID=UPI0022E29705|nr:uncharacterized protein LOC128246640 [Mya arenaria]
MSVEDPLGVSHTDEIEQFLMPLDDLLEVSYTDDVQYLLMPVDDPLGVSYADEVENLLMPVDDPLGISYADEVENLLMPLDDPLGVSFTNTASDDYFLDDLSISGPLCASTPCKPDTSRVSAVTTPQRSFKNFLEREVNSAQKMKNKALEASSIADALNYKCSCNNQCLKDYTFRQIRSERKAFWEKPQFDRKKKLRMYLLDTNKEGRFTYIFYNKKKLCVNSFLKLLRINKNNFYLSNNDFAPKGKSKDARTLNDINWLENCASFYGDRMPNSNDILLPYKTVKESIYTKYTREEDHPVSRAQFFKTWKSYFPPLKIKQSNSFSKCSTCVSLERQREKAGSAVERAKFSSLKDEHHERQQMERRYYYQKRDASRTQQETYLSLIIDGMDQAKTSLPHFAGRQSKSISNVDLLKTHVTGVINHGNGGFHSYVEINQFPHDPNLTINILLRALKKSADKQMNFLPPVLYLQFDNCCRENKNHCVLAFAELLV